MEIKPEKNKKTPKYAAALAAVCVAAGSATGCTDPSQLRSELKEIFGFSSDSESYVEIGGEVAIEGDIAVDSSFEGDVYVPPMTESELTTEGTVRVPEFSEPILSEGVAPMPEETELYIEGGAPMPVDSECNGADDCFSPIHEE